MKYESIDRYDTEDFTDNGDDTEFMPKESAEKYVKEHEVKYRPFTMEEFKAYRDCWFVIEDYNHTVKFNRCALNCAISGSSTFTYQDILELLTFEDGTPCGVKE